MIVIFISMEKKLIIIGVDRKIYISIQDEKKILIIVKLNTTGFLIFWI